MSPLDGLRKSNDKIYRADARVNFLINEVIDESKTLQQPIIKKIKHSSEQKFLILKIGLIAVLIVLISGAMYFSEKIFSSRSNVLTELNRFNPFARLAYLISPADKRLAGELDDGINILLLGIGGEGHEGPYLTDTIILVSIKPSTGEIGLISLPRDMVVKFKDNQWYKINQIYSMGRITSPEEGIASITETIEDNFKINVHYYGLITFDGFKKFIDEIGGIMVNVPQSFTDYTFPITKEGVGTVSFQSGSQTMDGTTALNFARSRHGTNFEDSDFARSRRQQLIIQAIKDKMFKFTTLFNPTKLTAIFDLLGNSVETNMSIWQALKIGTMVQNTNEDKIYRIILDDGPDSLLESGFNQEGAYILQPKNGHYDLLNRQIANLFNIGIIKAEAAKIKIQNGTAKGGLAYWTAVALEKLGYKIVSYENADKQDYSQTLIYDLSDKDKKNSLKWLREELNAQIAKDVPAEFNQNTNAENTDINDENAPDILIILGSDYADNFKLPEPAPIKTSTSTPETTATSTSEITSTSTNQTNE